MAPKSYIPEPRMTRQPPFTAEVADAISIDGQTIPRRNARTSKQLLSQPEDGVSTLFDIVTRSANKFGDQPCLGSRTLIQKHYETKKVKKVVDGEVREVDKKWTYFELGPYQYMTFKEYHMLVLEIGAGLRKLGLVATDKVHMFASTSAHWLATAHGAMSQSMPIVTAYDTLGEEGLRHSLVATKAKAIFLEPHLLRTLLNTLNDAKVIKYIVYNTDSENDIRQEDVEALKTTHSHITLLSFEELRQLGKLNPVETVLPTADDLACIMYTSGSTGVPKGVELKHRNVVATMAGVKTVVGEVLQPGERMLDYLPLAHIFEFVLEHAALYFGLVMGYGSPKTLSEASCRNCKGDIQEFKPSILVGIPAVWETVKKGIIAKVEGGSPILRNVFWGAFRAKRFLMSSGLPGSAMLDSVVFNKVKEATGGQLKICLTAAAPISRETQEFISMTIAPVISAYGATETTGMGAITDPRAWTIDAAGEMESCVEVKLVDFPDAGYFATNKPNAQGEVWIRGASVMERYYDAPELTAAAIDPEGWFMTGDIGEWDKHGHLRIIDRKKNLVKTLNGEYIALEKLESLYRSAAVVANICVYASTTETHPIAIIQPAEPALIKLAAAIGVQGHGIGDLPHNERVQHEVLQQLQAIGRRSGLAGIEIIVGVVLADEEWTPQNGLVTPTSKLNRKGLFDKYQKGIETSYAKSKK